MESVLKSNTLGGRQQSKKLVLFQGSKDASMFLCFLCITLLYVIVGLGCNKRVG